MHSTNASSESLQVTAVMITGLHERRYPLARIAIECFRAQTYPSRELLIVNHGSLALNPGDATIRELRIAKGPGDTVGDLRNFALDEARGDLIICWDDDDWYSPDRIDTQVAAYRQSSGDCAVVLRNGIRFNLIDRCAKYVRRPDGMPGSILHSIKVPFRYPSLVTGSDQLFLDRFSTRVALENAPSLYIRTYHGLNLWPGEHIMKGMVGPAHRGNLKVEADDRRLLADITLQYGDVYDAFLQP